MPETYSPLVWHNDQTPAINETNLNRIEVGVEALDDRAAALELGICPVVVVPFASSITLNATQGGLFRCVASADLTLDQIVGGTDGQTIVFEVQASGGPRTLHFTGSTDTETIAVGQWWVGVFRYIPGTGWVRDETAAGAASSGNDLNILAPQNLSYSPTITPDASTGALFRVTAPGDFTLANPISGTDGQAVVVEVLASGGQRTVSFSAGVGSPIVVPSGVRRTVTLRYNASAGTWVLADNALRDDNALQVVIYAGGAYPARPSVTAGRVRFIGPVQPTTWLDNDEWVQTS